MRKLFLIAFSFSILLLSCMEKEAPILTPNFENAVIKNFGGLDGCGWIIILEDGSRLEPLNLDDFSIIPTEGLEIEIEYSIKTDIASICMVGAAAEISAIQER